jgi:hypothetical protein
MQWKGGACLTVAALATGPRRWTTTVGAAHPTGDGKCQA